MNRQGGKDVMTSDTGAGRAGRREATSNRFVRWVWLVVAALSAWAQTLIASMLTGLIAYLVSMLKEITGFLFGGSAGGDDVTAQLGEAMQAAAMKGTDEKPSQ